MHQKQGIGGKNIDSHDTENLEQGQRNTKPHDLNLLVLKCKRLNKAMTNRG